jgi:excinuclease UvrABC nuclease subunit
MAKGPDRKGEELVFDKTDYELARLMTAFKPLLRQVRDEAHRFAIAFHRRRRAKSFLG